MNQHLAAVVVPLLLVAFAVYRRVRRTIGFQKLRRRPLIVRTALLCGIALLALGLGALHPVAYLGDASGLLAGTLIALLAARFLTFEKRDGVWYYRSHVWIEAVVLVLFIGRLVFDLLVRLSGGQHTGAATQLEDPFTSGVLLMFVGYYVLFALTLLRRERGLADGQTPAPG